MRQGAVILLSFLFCSSALAQPFERADSFFERDFLTKDRVVRESTEDNDQASERQEDKDSWEAPQDALRGSTVAGSDKVRDYRNRTGVFAPTPTVPAQYRGYDSIPLGGGAAVILPRDRDDFGGDDFGR